MKIFTARRSCVLLFAITALASQSSIAQVDCGEPVVSMGEVMAGFQAGFTGGAHTVTGAPEGQFVAIGGEARRGFIVPESGVASEQCDNDFILVTAWFGCGLANRTNQEGRECVLTGLEGRIPWFRIEVDGNQVDLMQTTAKFGLLPEPFTGTFALLTAGYIIEPFSLLPGPHTASFVFAWDPDRDGNVDAVFTSTADFTINESAAAAP